MRPSTARLFGAELRVWRWLQELNQAESTEENGEMGYAGRSWRRGQLHKEATLGWRHERLNRSERLDLRLQVEVKLRWIEA